MKKLLFTFLLTFSLQLFVFDVTFAQIDDNQIIDALDKLESQQDISEIQALNQDLSFRQFESCDDMENVLGDFVAKFFKDRGGYGGGPIPLVLEDAVVENTDVSLGVKNLAGPGFERVSSSTNDFSTTNIQVQGVDEADILKTDGDYIYYYNQRESAIFVLQSPLDRKNLLIDLDTAKIVKKINLPEKFFASQMYVYDDTLIIISQRQKNLRKQKFLNNELRTTVIIYDIQDPQKPKLLKLSDLDGNYHDSRMIDGKLYVVSQIYINRWYGKQVFENEDDIVIQSEEFLPKVIDVAYTKTKKKQNLRFDNKQYPYNISVKKASCENINYVLPKKDDIQSLDIYPSFTVIRTIHVNDVEEKPETTVIFGNTQTIYMSPQSLYLTNPIYTQRSFACPANARCILPWFESGQHTLIHKFSLKSGVEYLESSLVNGRPLNQRSMSEDNHGYFRILTQNWNRQIHTNLYILDDALNLEGILMNIEPGEEFKASRYIGDKLYLVTFERTDPLFVIDLANSKKPKILGELVIPGFSSYLHPYSTMENGVQYLIGLGQATRENERGGTVTAGIKLDLYKIDYNKTSTGDDCEDYHYSTCPLYCERICAPSNCTEPDEEGNVICTTDCDGGGSCVNKKESKYNKISIEQLYSKTWGDSNSTTEALNNPRMFVWDEKRKMLVLPMILTKPKKMKNCNIVYDDSGEEIAKNCYDTERYTTTFAGLKAIEIDIEKGIYEKYSYDYLDQLKNDKETYKRRDGIIYPWQFTQLHRRVGYLGDVLYTLNNVFADFRVMGENQSKMIKW